jgi:hypothetical protein
MKFVIRAIAAMGLATLAGCTGHRAPAKVASPSDQPPGVTDTWEPPEGLEFLRTVPELRGVSLEMREADFQKLVRSRARELKVFRDRRADQTSYLVSTNSGENVFVMFWPDGNCCGIQRMQPQPPRAHQR